MTRKRRRDRLSTLHVPTAARLHAVLEKAALERAAPLEKAALEKAALEKAALESFCRSAAQAKSLLDQKCGHPIWWQVAIYSCDECGVSWRTER